MPKRERERRSISRYPEALDNRNRKRKASTMARKLTLDFSNIRDFRKQLDENQFDFWKRFGVTQSGGSRYESGREMPTSVKMLIVFYQRGIVDDKDFAQARKFVS